jgi:tetratricopeptide (TPR) repeat protein
LSRITAALLVPALAMVMLEIILRISGYGHPTGFTIRISLNGETRLVQNEQFAATFMQPELARSSFPFCISPRKPENTVRIFVLGSSAVQGDPLVSYGLSRILQVMLEDRHPKIVFEVVNAAITAVNSHVVRQVAAECAALDPDLFVVYLGNNEVVGPYGAGTVFTRNVTSRIYINTSRLIRTSRSGQLLSSIMQSMGSAGNQDYRSFEGMSMFQDRHVASDDPRMDRVYTHFGKNIQAVFRSASRTDIPVILSTVMVNLNACPPFGSMHREGLESSHMQAWNKLYESGVQHLDQGEYEPTLELFLEAEKIDKVFAELHYRIAQCLELTGLIEEAWQRCQVACDLDTLRFRADSRINEIIRVSAAAENPVLVKLADPAVQPEEAEDLEIPGALYFDDHVHFSLAGNYRLAVQLTRQVEAMLPAFQASRNMPPLPSLDEVTEKLAYTDYARLRIAETMLGKFERPPFTFEFNHERNLAAHKQGIKDLKKSLDAPSKIRIDQLHIARIKQQPNDWVVYFNHTIFLAEIGHQFQRAREQFETVLRLQPRHAQAESNLGLVFMQLKNYRQALEYLEKGYQTDPNNLGALLNMGRAHMALGQFGRAEDILRKFIDRTPSRAAGYRSLAKCLTRMERHEEAREELNKALQMESDPGMPSTGLPPGEH